MKKILITGKKGQLAQALKAEFDAIKDIEVYFLGKNNLNLENPRSIQGTLAQIAPDYIVHTAAYTAVDLAEDYPKVALTINQYATEEIAKYCKKHNCKLLAISTDYIFDGKNNSPIKEEEPPNPINAYGKSKWLAEQEILSYLENQAIIIRTSWLVSSYGNNFAKTMTNLFNSGKESIRVVADQQGSPTYAPDLAQAIKTIILDSNWIAGTYHYANQGSCTWYELAKYLRDISGFKTVIHPITTQEFNARAQRPQYSVLSTQKIQDTFDIVIPDWKTSLKKMFPLPPTQ